MSLSYQLTLVHSKKISGDHIYFDVEKDCFSLDFSFGQNAVGNSKPSSRNFDIKVCTVYAMLYHNMQLWGKIMSRTI